LQDDRRSPIKHRLVLRRIDPEQGVRRFYSLMIERDLFGTVRLVRNWGRIGTNGQELVEVFASEIEADWALEVISLCLAATGLLGFVDPTDATRRNSYDSSAR
jgi:predicted DNA-binding WGR domain protein